MSNTDTLRGILAALEEDVDDLASWAALHDWLTEHDNEDWTPGQDVARLAGMAYRAVLLAATAGRSQIECVNFHYNGYAEPGYSDPAGGVIATGDWNVVTKWNEATHHYDTLDDSPARLGKLLEKLGVDLQWEDEWADCTECGMLVRTQPDGWDWRPYYWLGDGELLCADCAADNQVESVPGEEEED